MKEELIKQFLAKYPFQFADDHWFWEQELMQLLDQYYASFNKQKT